MAREYNVCFSCGCSKCDDRTVCIMRQAAHGCTGLCEHCPGECAPLARVGGKVIDTWTHRLLFGREPDASMNMDNVIPIDMDMRERSERLGLTHASGGAAGEHGEMEENDGKGGAATQV